MLVYLLKSGACLGILFLFYKIFLEKESVHVFKRYYLLAALVLALVIPAVVFTEYVEVPTPTYTAVQYVQTSQEVINVPPALEADIVDIAPILWSIYFIGLLFFGIKFIKNLFQIYRRIRKNQKLKLERFTQVLLKEKLPPHTFFSYIFLNKKNLEADKIPKEVLLHEETHALQKHSWDVIFVEFLQVIFWVNPFIFLSKKAIKLNHEFLADHAVLKNNIDETSYKNTLLSYLSPDSEKHYQSSMANAITNSSYSSIKKRFKIMKTQTSKKSVLLRSLLLLPLLSILLYSFSETKIENIVIYPEIDADLKEELKYVNSLNINYYDGDGNIFRTTGKQPTQKKLEDWKNSEKYAIWIDRNHVKNSILEDYKPSDFRNYSLSYVYDNARSEEFPQEFQLSLITQKEFAIQERESNKYFTININKAGQLLIDGNLVSLAKADDNIKHLLQENSYEWVSVFADANAPSEVFNEIRRLLIKNQVMQISTKLVPPEMDVVFRYNALAKDIKTTQKDQEANIITLEELFEKMTSMQKISVKTPSQIIDSIHQNPATKEQLKEYNTLAKKYNQQKDGERVIRFEDVSKLYEIYKVMTTAQEESAEPFPNLPPPPPPMESQEEIDAIKTYETPNGESITIQDKATKEELKEYNSLAKNYNKMLSKSNSIQIKMQDVERLKYIYGVMTAAQKESAESYPDFPEPPPMPKAPDAPKHPRVKDGEKSNIPKPPSPPKAPRNIDIDEEAMRQEIENQEMVAYENVAVYIHNSNSSESIAINTPNRSQTIQSLAERDAQFYLDGEMISTEYGLELIAQNNDLTVQTHPYTNRQPLVKIFTDIEDPAIVAPKAPPTPKSPLDHVIEMAKKDAVFYLEGEEISSDKAIAILKKNKNINIDSRTRNGKKPVVKLSTEPITIE